VTPRIFLVSAEPSGDQLGREVVEALRNQRPDVVLAGIGGREMAEVGLTSDIDTSPLSVVGLVDGLKAYPKVIELADAAVDEIIAFTPDTVVLIDSWGFMLRVAQRLKKRCPKIRLIKLIGPQVWATRAGRAKTLANCVDHLLVMFDMEEPFYKPHGLKTTVIGSPAIGRTNHGNGAAFRRKHGIPSDRQMLLLLPGSRPSEIKRVAPTLMRAVTDLFLDIFPNISEIGTVLTETGERYDAMAAADLAIACSGTVTTELAMQGTPFLVGYKLGWTTWAIARTLLYKPKYMTLLNIVADKEIAPEYLQTKFTADALAAKVLERLSDKTSLDTQIAQQNLTLKKLGKNKASAAQLAAEAILKDLNASL